MSTTLDRESIEDIHIDNDNKPLIEEGKKLTVHHIYRSWESWDQIFYLRALPGLGLGRVLAHGHSSMGRRYYEYL